MYIKWRIFITLKMLPFVWFVFKTNLTCFLPFSLSLKFLIIFFKSLRQSSLFLSKCLNQILIWHSYCFCLFQGFGFGWRLSLFKNFFNWLRIWRKTLLFLVRFIHFNLIFLCSILCNWLSHFNLFLMRRRILLFIVLRFQYMESSYNILIHLLKVIEILII